MLPGRSTQDSLSNRDNAAALRAKLINLIAITLRIYATPPEKARGVNFFIRKKSPGKTISSKDRTTAETRAIALDLSNVSLVKEQCREGGG